MVNNISVALIFVITIINIFIATFGVDDRQTFRAHRPELFMAEKNRDTIGTMGNFTSP